MELPKVPSGMWMYEGFSPVYPVVPRTNVKACEEYYEEVIKYIMFSLSDTETTLENVRVSHYGISANVIRRGKQNKEIDINYMSNNTLLIDELSNFNSDVVSIRVDGDFPFEKVKTYLENF